jgi:hypothetical protein
VRVAIALAVLAVPGLAHADDLVPTTAQAKLAGTTVEMTASFDLDVEGPLAANSESLALPADAVITGATVRIQNASHRLQLLPSDEVTKQLGMIYETSGAGSARAWAVQVTSYRGSSSIQIAAPTSAHVVLDLDIEIATRFEVDQRRITIPCGWPVIAGAGRPLGTCDETQQVAFDIPRLKDISVTGQSATLPHDDVARVEIDLPRQLSKIPADLHTLIVVDRSRSLSEAEQATASSVIAAYLKQVPQSRVQAIGYARTARTLLPRWSPAKGAASKIESALAAQPLRNGSDLERALALAGTQLAGVSGTRRVLLLTDERISYETQDNLSTLASKYLPRNTLVHVVDIAGWESGFVRYDDAVLASLAADTGGITVAARDDGGGLDALLLARPITLDHIRVSAAGLTATLEREGSCSATETTGLAEGQSCSWVGTGLVDATTEVTLTGSLWGTEISRTLVPDPTRALELARRLSTHPDLENTVPLRDDILLAARAVNGAWSLLAMWGTGGYQDLAEDRSTFGFSGSHSSSSHCGGYVKNHDGYEAELEEQLADAVTACRPAGAITVHVETTLQEIVSVYVKASDDLGQWAESCIAERVWNTSIALSNPDSHRTATLRFQP